MPFRAMLWCSLFLIGCLVSACGGRGMSLTGLSFPPPPSSESPDEIPDAFPGFAFADETDEPFAPAYGAGGYSAQISMSRAYFRQYDTSGLLLYGVGKLGKQITAAPIPCVMTRAQLYGAPSANWWPMHDAQGGKEILYFPLGEKLSLTTSGQISIGPRSAAGVFLEVIDENGVPVRQAELFTMGNTGYGGISSTFSKNVIVLPVKPFKLYRIRAGIYVHTPDDGLCTTNHGANVSSDELSVTLEDYAL